MQPLRPAIVVLSLLAISGGLLIRHVRTDASDALALREACRLARVKHPPAAPRVEVRKAAHALILFSGSTQLKRYRVGLGFHPVGDKRRQGTAALPMASSTSAPASSKASSTASWA